MPIGAVPPANIDASGITVEISPPTEETAAVTYEEQTGAFSVPAGQRFVEIYNAGAVRPGDTEANATVNGASLSVGATWKFESEAQTDKVFLSPAITGTGNGSRLMIKYWS